MYIEIKNWIKTDTGIVGQSLRAFLKGLKSIEIPVIPIFHKCIYLLHVIMVNLFHSAIQFLYFTPIFKSRVKGTKRRLSLTEGMPLIQGPLIIYLGDDVRISGISTFCGRSSSNNPPEIHIGCNVDIGWQNLISVGTKVIIEDDVRFAGKVFLAGFPGHPYDCDKRALGEPDTEDQIGHIIVKRGAWVGMNSTIIAGVTIGEGCIVAANSVVTKDTPAFTLIGGNPAKVIKKLAEV